MRAESIQLSLNFSYRGRDFFAGHLLTGTRYISFHFFLFFFNGAIKFLGRRDEISSCRGRRFGRSEIPFGNFFNTYNVNLRYNGIMRI